MTLLGYLATLLGLLVWAWIFNVLVRELEDVTSRAKDNSLADRVNTFMWDLATWFNIDLKERDPENIPELWRYPDHDPKVSVFSHPDYKAVGPLYIVVGSEEQKQQALRATEYLHDKWDTDTDYIAVNEIVHCYSHPDSVVVDPDFIAKQGATK